MPPSPRRCSALRASSNVLRVPMPLDPLVPSVGSRHRRVSFLPYTFMRECRLRGRGSNPNRGIVFVDVPPRNFSKRIPVESPKDSCTGRSDRTKNRRNDDPLRRRTRNYIQQVDDTKLLSRSHPGVVEMHSGVRRPVLAPQRYRLPAIPTPKTDAQRSPCSSARRRTSAALYAFITSRSCRQPTTRPF